MISTFEWTISRRYIGYSNKFSSIVSYLATIGIMLGVMTLVIVMSVMNGYQTELINKILGINGHLSVESRVSRIEYYEHIINNISKIPHIKYVAPLITGQALIETNGMYAGVIVRGMNNSSLQHKPMIHNSIIPKNYHWRDDGILLGASLAKSLNVKIGDRVRILIPNFEITVIGSIPKIKTFVVIGAFDIGIHEYNVGTAFISITLAQKLFNKPNAVSEIEIVASHLSHVNEIKTNVANMLQGTNLLITDWGLANKSLIKALHVEKTTMFCILVLIIIISAFNIVSGLSMLVREKYKSIAILRALGASRKSIIMIFVLSGAYLGVLGTTFGAIIGSAIVWNIETIRQWLESLTGIALFDPVIYFLTSLPSSPNVEEIITIMSISIALSILATIYPALKAANMLPSEALRYE